MKRTIIFTCLLVFGLFFLTSSTPETDKGIKITICHIPPGNPSNAHSITISINALPAHLAHGDSIGECDTNECDPPACPCPDGTCHEECCDF
jgi:hypothetical protein